MQSKPFHLETDDGTKGVSLRTDSRFTDRMFGGRRLHLRVIDDQQALATVLAPLSRLCLAIRQFFRIDQNSSLFYGPGGEGETRLDSVPYPGR
jgi:hypothetical protein